MSRTSCISIGIQQIKPTHVLKRLTNHMQACLVVKNWKPTTAFLRDLLTNRMQACLVVKKWKLTTAFLERGSQIIWKRTEILGALSDTGISGKHDLPDVDIHTESHLVNHLVYELWLLPSSKPIWLPVLDFHLIFILLNMLLSSFCFVGPKGRQPIRLHGFPRPPFVIVVFLVCGE